MFKKSRLKIAQEKAQASITRTNKVIEELGEHTSALYDSLTAIQDCFDNIRNVPSDKLLQYEELKKIRLNWKTQAEKIEKDYNAAAAKKAGAGAAGAGVGVAVVAMGPAAALGIATTFGVASTGTAISALSGAAATNAALAWLGGGALVAGGGGMAAGEAFLTLAGPVGWAIAGAALLTSGILLLINRSDRKRIEDVFTLISDRDVKSYDLATVELKERITRIDDESKKLDSAISSINTFGTDYSKMTESQQYELGSYVNLMHASTQMLTNPIFGLLPKYTDADLDKFFADTGVKKTVSKGKRNLMVSLANLVYKIRLDEKDTKLLWKSLRKNKKLLGSLDVSKKEFDIDVMHYVKKALKHKYSTTS